MNSPPAPLSLLTYSSLFPNSRQHRHGIFIERRLHHLMEDFPVDARVVAPVPWFPSSNARFGRYGVFGSVPLEESYSGLPVWHPRYVVVPMVSWFVAPLLMYAATRRLVRRLHATKAIEVIDAHFFFPDGVAALMVGRELGIPVCISARGSDIAQMLDFAVSRRWIQWAAARADGLITVAAALRDRLVECGVATERIHVLRNGVDLERFRPLNREQAREALGFSGTALLSVGNLIELKGHHLIIEALRELPGHSLTIIGDGPERAQLESLALRLGVAERVRFVGLVSQAELPRWYVAADALVLASSREGWANVLLEAMACGTPVVATRVGGTPEVVAAPDAGLLVDERSARSIAAGVRTLLAAPPARSATRGYAERFSWHETSRGQFELFSRLRDSRGTRDPN